MNFFLRNKEVKNASWLIGGRIVQMLLSLIIGILTTRYLGPADYGLISYGTAMVSFFSSLCTLGLNSVIIKEFVDHPQEQGEALGSALLLRLLSSVTTALMIWGIVSVIDRDAPMTITVVVICSIGSVFHVFELFNYWFQNQYKSKVTALVTLSAYVVVSGYRILLLIMQADVRWFAAAVSLDYIVVAICMLCAYRRHGGPSLRCSLRKTKSLLGMSYHYILSSMMVSIYGQTDKLMLKQMLNETEVGYYAVATQLCAMWTFVLQAIIDSIYPTILRLHSIDKDAFNKKNRQLYAIVFYVSCFVSVGFVLLGSWVISFLYGENYSSAGLPLKIITWYTAFSYLGVARNAWIVSEGKQRYLKYMYCSAAVINVALNCLFIPVMGAAGAAVASLITQVFTSIVLPSFFKEIRPNAKLMLEAILLKDIFELGRKDEFVS